MKSKACNEFWDFLDKHSENRAHSRIAYDLGGEAYVELMKWIDYPHETTSRLDNEAQLLLILLILEASK